MLVFVNDFPKRGVSIKCFFFFSNSWYKLFLTDCAIFELKTVQITKQGDEKCLHNKIVLKTLLVVNQS